MEALNCEKDFKRTKDMTAALKKRKPSLKDKYGDPIYVLELMDTFFKEGELESLTDVISSYVKNSSKYSSQEEFADIIGTSKATLTRMYAHGNVSLNVLFDAIYQIREDAKL